MPERVDKFPFRRGGRASNEMWPKIADGSVWRIPAVEWKETYRTMDSVRSAATYWARHNNMKVKSAARDEDVWVQFIPVEEDLSDDASDSP